MNNSIIQEIKSLPPLSKTVIDVIEYSKHENKTVEGLLELIQDDSLLIASLLKISNSALFGFKNKVTDVKNMINLLGVNFTISLILANSIENSFKADFSPYGISANSFKHTTLIAIKLMQFWISQIDIELKNRLVLPAILMNLGKYLIASNLIKTDQGDEFLANIQKDILDIDKVEKQFCGYTALEVTVLLLEHWKIDLDIIDYLKYMSNMDDSPSYLSQSVKILEVVYIICNISAPCDEYVIENAINQAQQYNLDIASLKNAIELTSDLVKD